MKDPPMSGKQKARNCVKAYRHVSEEAILKRSLIRHALSPQAGRPKAKVF